jgi:hypothetical protein
MFDDDIPISREESNRSLYWLNLFTVTVPPVCEAWLLIQKACFPPNGRLKDCTVLTFVVVGRFAVVAVALAIAYKFTWNQKADMFQSYRNVPNTETFFFPNTVSFFLATFAGKSTTQHSTDASLCQSESEKHKYVEFLATSGIPGHPWQPLAFLASNT